jgi:hypothetical protein
VSAAQTTIAGIVAFVAIAAIVISLVVFLAGQIKAQGELIGARIDDLRDALNGRIDDLRSEVGGRLDRIDKRLDEERERS